MDTGNKISFAFKVKALNDDQTEWYYDGDIEFDDGRVSVPARPAVGDRVRLTAGAKKTTGVLAGGAIGHAEHLQG